MGLGPEGWGQKKKRADPLGIIGAPTLSLAVPDDCSGLSYVFSRVDANYLEAYSATTVGPR